ncbi:hypothetical protein KI387_012489, partial [Taxus chinensis]
FEWAWQNPKMSLAVKEAAKGLKQLGGIAGKIRLAYTMLTLSEWKSLNITVNFLSTKHVGNTKGCPTLPSHMKVQICPVDELPCYTDNWLSDGEDDMEEEHCFGSDVSDPEERVEGDKGTSHQKKSTKFKKWEEQECDRQPAKKCRRRGRSLKQLKSSIPADELGSRVTFPSPKKLSLSTVQADEETEGSIRLNGFFSNHDCLLQISDSENNEDRDGASGSFLIPNTNSPVNFKQETSYGVKNNLSINFRTDCFLANDNEANNPKDISDDFSIKNKMIASPDPAEYNFSNDLKFDSIVPKDCEVDEIINNMDDFSIKSKIKRSSNTIDFPSFQEYSPLCYISPLKTSEEASLSFTSPCKSTPTTKTVSVNCTFLSPIASQGQIISISSTPRPVSRGVIDLTDSPAT